MKPRDNVLKLVFPDGETFDSVRKGWPEGFVISCLTRLWDAWDDLLTEFANKSIDPTAIDWLSVSQKERSLAYLHGMHAIARQRLEDPFLFRPEAHELESVSSSRAMPPSYDFAFYLRAGNFRIALPVEAKYLLDAGDVQRLCSDLTQKYLPGTGAPLSPVAGLLGYLLSGTADDAFVAIASHLACTLVSVSEFESRTHRISKSHSRPGNKLKLDCHWLLCAWSTSTAQARSARSI